MRCEHDQVKMTESLAERITELLPEKDKDESGIRVDTLRRLAEVCVAQQDYHLATKKYTQAGMKDKAMDTLLKSGDTEKIIYFATVPQCFCAVFACVSLCLSVYVYCINRNNYFTAVLRSNDIWIRACDAPDAPANHLL